MPLALTVKQILAIDLGTDMFPALALGMEKPEPDVMKHPPRPRYQPLLDRNVLSRALWLGMLEAILCFSGFILIFMLSGHVSEIGLSFLANIAIPENWRLSLSFGGTILLASTVYHAGVVMAQIGNAFACRSDRARSSYLGWLSNKYLLAGVLFELAGILGIIYIPFFAKIFNHVPLPVWMWAGLAVFPLTLYMIEWIRKAIYRTSIKNKHQEKSSTLSLKEVNQ